MFLLEIILALAACTPFLDWKLFNPVPESYK